jgi:hypothetical protein
MYGLLGAARLALRVALWAIAAAAWRRRTVSPEQSMNVAVDRADVAFRATCYLANSHRSLTGH